MRTFSPALVLGATLLTSLCSTSLRAQDQQQSAAAATSQTTASASQPSHTANPQHQAKRMARKLGLTQDQESKLEPILAERQQQLESTRTDATLAQKDKRAKLSSIRQDTDTKIEAMLNDTQKQQYERMKQAHKESKQQGSSSSGS